jgi:hypothetical protein
MNLLDFDDSEPAATATATPSGAPGTNKALPVLASLAANENGVPPSFIPKIQHMLTYMRQSVATTTLQTSKPRRLHPPQQPQLPQHL